MGWRAGTTTLCRSRLSPPVRVLWIRLQVKSATRRKGTLEKTSLTSVRPWSWAWPHRTASCRRRISGLHTAGNSGQCAEEKKKKYSNNQCYGSGSGGSVINWPTESGPCYCSCSWRGTPNGPLGPLRECLHPVVLYTSILSPSLSPYRCESPVQLCVFCNELSVPNYLSFVEDSTKFYKKVQHFKYLMLYYLFDSIQ
jgi:hypothetical protein